MNKTKNYECVILFFPIHFKSFNTSCVTFVRYFIRTCSSTNGTLQNWRVFVLNHPKTNEYTPSTNRSFTALKYKRYTGSEGAPCVKYVRTFLCDNNGFGYPYLGNNGINLYANPGVNTTSKNSSISGVHRNHHTGEII